MKQNVREFNVDLAVEAGVSAAIVHQAILDMADSQFLHGGRLIDGKRYVAETKFDFLSAMPFLVPQSLAMALRRLEEAGRIWVRDNPNDPSGLSKLYSADLAEWV